MRRGLKEGGEIWRSERIETLVHHFSQMEISANIKRSQTKFRPQSRRRVQPRTMKGNSTSIVEEGLESLGVIFSATFPYNITVIKAG
jgi:hypothetical protein